MTGVVAPHRSPGIIQSGAYLAVSELSRNSTAKALAFGASSVYRG